LWPEAAAVCEPSAAAITGLVPTATEPLNPTNAIIKPTRKPARMKTSFLIAPGIFYREGRQFTL
jgi:hypothetical protein